MSRFLLPPWQKQWVRTHLPAKRVAVAEGIQLLWA